METCELCGKQTKNLAGLKAHMRMKHTPDLTEAVVDRSSVGSQEKYHLPPGPSKLGAIRAVKMIAPVCGICTDGIHPKDWFNTCPHDPYFHPQEVPEVVEEREPQPDGTYIVTDRKTIHRVRRMPNLRQVPFSPRHLNNPVEKQKRRGWVLPEFLNVHPFCQAIDCWSQDLPPQWRSDRYGEYCGEAHAKTMVLQQMEKPLNTDPVERNKQYAETQFS